MEKYSNLLDTAIQSIINVQKETEVDSLFSSPETTKEGEIRGLEDFELVCFFVVKDV